MGIYVLWHAAKGRRVSGEVCAKLALSVETVRSMKVRSGVRAGESGAAPCSEMPKELPMDEPPLLP